MSAEPPVTAQAPPAVSDAPVELIVPPSRPLAPPSHTRRGSWVTAVSLLAAGLVVGGVGTRLLFPAAVHADRPGETGVTADSAEEGVVSFDRERQSAAGVEVATVTPHPLVARTWRTGRVALHEDRLAHICPPAEGVVREVAVRLGQTVAAGDKLAVIESKEFGQAKLDAHRAKLAVAAEREVLDRTRTTMANAEELLKLLAADTPVVDIEKVMTGKPIGDWRQQLVAAYSRRNQLKEQVASQAGSEGVVSALTRRKTEVEADAAAAAYTSLVEESRFQVKNQVRQAELKLKEAETASDMARTKLFLYGLTAKQIDAIDPIAEGSAAAHLVVAAPFAGVVVEKHAVRSERVEPKDQLFLVADLSRVWVQADLFEADLPLTRGLKDRPIVFRSAVAGVAERTATVVYAGDLIDRASRSLTLTAEAVNADGVLKPGLFVEVGLDAGDRTQAIQVPAGAVLRHENKPFVFVQAGDEQFKRTPVELGRTGDGLVEVTAGLKGGDRVVVRGGFMLKSELLKDQMVGE